MCVPEVPNSSSPRFWAYNLLVWWVLGILLWAIPAWALELDINRDTFWGVLGYSHNLTYNFSTLFPSFFSLYIA